MTPHSISIREDFSISLHGFSGVAARQDWAGTGKNLMDQLWQEVRSKQLPNKGLTIWVYDEGYRLFTGVELTVPPPIGCALVNKTVSLPRYVYSKHLGPYHEIRSAYAAVHEEFKKAGIRAGLPYVEIYGHWNDDPSKLETELLWCIK
jgi:effector-binding domain-containing protein